jgi:hypothetical protein
MDGKLYLLNVFDDQGKVRSYHINLSQDIKDNQTLQLPKEHLGDCACVIHQRYLMEAKSIFEGNKNGSKKSQNFHQLRLGRQRKS